MRNTVIIDYQFQKDNTNNWHFDTEIFNSKVGILFFSYLATDFTPLQKLYGHTRFFLSTQTSKKMFIFISKRHS